MKNELLTLIKLQSITSTNEKVEFTSKHKDNRLFIKLLKFIVDDKVVTNISRAKFNKQTTSTINTIISTIDEFLEFLELKCTGKNEDIALIHNFIDEQDKELQPILSAIACKDLAIGVGTKFYNKAVNKKDVIFDFPYMGAIAYDSKKVANLFKTSDQVESNLKLDGLFIGASVTDSKITCYLRSGLQAIINGGKLVEELKKLRELESHDFMLNGELLIDGIEDRATANGIIRGLISSNTKINNGDEKESAKFQKKYGMSISEVEDRLVYYVWDFLDIKVLNGFEIDTPYYKRFSILQYYLQVINPIFKSIKIVPSRRVDNEQEAMSHFQELLSLGYEGTILKDMNKGFKSGKPVWQVKYKMVAECELRVLSYELGKEGTKYSSVIGSLYCESECGKLKTKVSGFTDEQRQSILDDIDNYIWKIITVKNNGLSKAKDNEHMSLLYPVFIEIRDKDKADTLEEIIKIQESIIGKI